MKKKKEKKMAMLNPQLPPPQTAHALRLNGHATDSRAQASGTSPHRSIARRNIQDAWRAAMIKSVMEVFLGGFFWGGR